ncbi:hypothetical protein DN730_01820 [Marinomonas piezotolerans]|uniref:Uncharacterized protein n=1 Tax=Marinomonas piezotolerans TaxID=2213058 RepID=A0A370UDD7_9GAMM|nr:hypothetical protein [Marinomonas piezotolerans]RDL45810.1 hypothetical protein DN730_01820 [Marinomonas piezotolerans]
MHLPSYLNKICFFLLTFSFVLGSATSWAFSVDDLIDCLENDSCLEDIDVSVDDINLDDLDIDISLPELPILTNPQELQSQFELTLNSYKDQLETLKNTYTGQALDVAIAKLDNDFQVLMSTQVNQAADAFADKENEASRTQDELIVTYEEQLLAVQTEQVSIERKLKAAQVQANQILLSSLDRMRAYEVQVEQKLRHEYKKLVRESQTEIQSIIVLSDFSRNLEEPMVFEPPKKIAEAPQSSLSFGVYADDNGQQAIPLQYAFNSWLRAGVTLPIQQDEADGMGRLGLYHRGTWLDLIEVYGLQSFDDSQQHALGIQFREKVAALSLGIDLQQGKVGEPLHYNKLYVSTGLVGRSSGIRLGYHRLKYQRDELQSHLDSDYFELALQKQVRPFNNLPIPITFALSVFSPENNRFSLDGQSSNIDGEGWRLRFGLTSRF